MKSSIKVGCTLLPGPCPSIHKYMKTLSEKGNFLHQVMFNLNFTFLKSPIAHEPLLVYILIYFQKSKFVHNLAAYSVADPDLLLYGER